jgi:hypothetical protein
MQRAGLALPRDSELLTEARARGSSSEVRPRAGGRAGGRR